MLRWIVRAGWTVLVVSVAVTQVAAEPLTALWEVRGGAPELVSALERPEELLALAIAPGSRRAAAAYPAGRRGERGMVRLIESDGAVPTDLEMPGAVRGLVFGGQGEVLYVLMHRPVKRRAGDGYLVRIEFDSLRARREMRLPGTARDLARTIDGAALLVASDNEIRTILIPELRSGRLFRILGENRSVVSLPGNRVLLGQDDGLALVDLDDRPEPDRMPVRERLETTSPVTGLLVSEDSSRGMARLEDGSLLRFWTDPLRTAAEGPPRGEPAPPPRPPSEPPSVAPGPVETPQPPTPDEPAPPPAETPQPRPPGEPPSVVPAPVDTPQPPTPDEPAPPVEAPRPAPAAPPAGAEPQIVGRISGPAAAEVRAVVLLGPDDLTRVAARVRPAANGGWSVDELPPGRYRVQLDAGGSRQLITSPPFRTVVVETGKRVRVAEIVAQRTL